QGDPRRTAFGEAVEGGEGLVEVEVGGRRGGPQDAGVGQAHAHRVAGEEDAALRVVQRQVVLGVAGRVDGGQRAAATDLDGLAVGQHVDALGRGRVETAVQGVEQVAVDHRRRSHQPAGVDQVAGAPFVHVHGG